MKSVRLALATAISAATLALPGVAAAAPVQLDNGMVTVELPAQAQEKTSWCWAGAATAVAIHHGATITQNEFCNLAKGLPRDGSCPNQTGSMEDIQRAYRALQIHPGRILDRTLSFGEIKAEIDADRPVLVRVGLNSGLGHYYVIEGYNEQDGSIQWIDPWMSARRVHTGSYEKFVHNDLYTWSHTLTQIGTRTAHA